MFFIVVVLSIRFTKMKFQANLTKYQYVAIQILFRKNKKETPSESR